MFWHSLCTRLDSCTFMSGDIQRPKGVRGLRIEPSIGPSSVVMMKPHHGFTLVELMVALSIIGLLVVVGFPMFSEGQVGAKRNVCLDRQHTVFEAALMYCADSVLASGTVNATVLQPELLQPPATDCPSQQDGSCDDYSIVIESGAPIDIICNIKGDVHPWFPH